MPYKIKVDVFAPYASNLINSIVAKDVILLSLIICIQN